MFKFKPRDAAELDRFQRADEVARKLDPALAKLSNKGDQLIARVLFNCPSWHTDPTMIGLPGMQQVIEALGDADLITARQHFADRYPEGVPAFEITEKGLDVLEELVGPDLTNDACAQRAWYRENSSYEGWMARVRVATVKKVLGTS